MKRFITVVLALLFGASSILVAQQTQPAAVQQGDATAFRGQTEGQLAAQATGTGGWMVGGVVTDVLTGLIGTEIIWAIAGTSDVSFHRTSGL